VSCWKKDSHPKIKNQKLTADERGSDFPGATIYNTVPLIVKNSNLPALPPRVVYLHDTSTVVPILLLNANPGKWNANDILGYFVLAGPGVGFTNSQSDVNEFNTFMSQQKFTCVTTSGTAAAVAPTSKNQIRQFHSQGANGRSGHRDQSLPISILRAYLWAILGPSLFKRRPFLVELVFQ
jgi:hypothetical protein